MKGALMSMHVSGLLLIFVFLLTVSAEAQVGPLGKYLELVPPPHGGELSRKLPGVYLSSMLVLEEALAGQARDYLNVRRRRKGVASNLKDSEATLRYTLRSATSALEGVKATTRSTPPDLYEGYMLARFVRVQTLTHEIKLLLSGSVSSTSTTTLERLLSEIEHESVHTLAATTATGR